MVGVVASGATGTGQTGQAAVAAAVLTPVLPAGLQPLGKVMTAGAVHPDRLVVAEAAGAAQAPVEQADKREMAGMVIPVLLLVAQ